MFLSKIIAILYPSGQNGKCRLSRIHKKSLSCVFGHRDGMWAQIGAKILLTRNVITDAPALILLCISWRGGQTFYALWNKTLKPFPPCEMLFFIYYFNKVFCGFH